MHSRKPVKLSQCIDDMHAYTNLTDHVFHQILLSTDPNLKEVSILMFYWLVYKYNTLSIVSGDTEQYIEKEAIQVCWTDSTCCVEKQNT